jgi:hypothetical protein
MLGRPDIHMQILNRTDSDLSHTEARFGANGCGWGNVGAKGTAYYLYFRDRITPIVEFSWTSNGVSHVEKVDLGESFPARRSGVLRFTVYEDHVTADFRKEISETKKPTVDPTL